MALQQLINLDREHDLPDPQQGFICDIAEITRIPSFSVIGGAALDMLEDTSKPINDVDLAVLDEVIDPDEIVDNLCAEGFEIVFGNRVYTIFNDLDIRTMLARRDDMELDISIVPSLSVIGHFTLQKVMWHYPNATYTDPYGVSLITEEDKKIEPITDVGGESPFLLTSQIFKLAAKYGARINDMDQNYVDRLVDDVGASASKPDQIQKITSCLASLFGAIARTKNPLQFCEDILGSKLVGAVSEPIEELLEKKIFGSQDGELLIGIAEASSRADIARLLHTISMREGLSSARATIELVANYRPWDSSLEKGQ